MNPKSRERRSKWSGLDVHVLGRSDTGIKPELVKALGATYHTGSVLNIGFEPDAIIECTGVGQVISDSIRKIGANGIICLIGIGHGSSNVSASIADIAAAAVLKNNVVVGSVNANKQHWFRASEFLARADRNWLSRLITRIERPPKYEDRLSHCFP